MVTTEQWSAFLSIIAALVITAASFRQWVWIAMDGDTSLRPWAKAMLATVVGLLLGALLLLGVAVIGEP